MNEDRFNPSQRNELLRVAREAVAMAARGERQRSPITSDPELRKNSGAFVTLTDREGSLRGCIGYIVADRPLLDTVAQAAAAAALRDPRFPPLTPEELDSLGISISVLSYPQPVREIQDIVPGRHGLIVHRGPRQGLLLPQVAARYGWNVTRFLDETCLKAGLNRGDWRDPGVVIESFTAEVFGDGEPEVA
ncbi:MAG: AmmeMemoRadiSam system protein A [bacterium]